MTSPTVILLAGISDRSTIACARSFESSDIPYIILRPKSGYTVPWGKTKYSEKTSTEKYPLLQEWEKFKKFIISFSSKNHGTSIIYPNGDFLAKKLAGDKGVFERNGVYVPLPHIETYNKIANKEDFLELGSKYGIQTSIKSKDNISTDELPCVAKPKKCGNDMGVYLIENESNYQDFKKKENSSDYFFQDYLTGPSYYYCALYNNGEQISSICQKTLLQQPGGGSVIKAHPTKLSDDLICSLENLLGNIGWDGVVMIEVIKHDSEYHLIEANARFWGPLQLCIDNDVDLPRTLYENYVGVNLSEQPDPKYNFGYLRRSAYYQGLWKKLIQSGQFKRSQPDEGDCYEYKDVWNRPDTKPIYMSENIRNIFLPISYIKSSVIDS